MGWEIEEIKSLIVLGGLPTVGFVIGSYTYTQNMIGAGVGGLIGGVLGIVMVLRRMYIILKEIK